MLMTLCYFAFCDAMEGETFDYFEGILVRIFATLLWLLAVVEFTGEIYGLAVLTHFCLKGWGAV